MWQSTLSTDFRPYCRFCICHHIQWSNREFNSHKMFSAFFVPFNIQNYRNKSEEQIIDWDCWRLTVRLVNWITCWKEQKKKIEKHITRNWRWYLDDLSTTKWHRYAQHLIFASAINLDLHIIAQPMAVARKTTTKPPRKETIRMQLLIS